MATEPEEPHFQIEGVLRTFGDQGSQQHLVSAVQTTASTARSMRGELLGFVDEYLEVALTIDITTQPLESIGSFLPDAADEATTCAE